MRTPTVKALEAQVAKVAASKMSVIVTGETGTGKTTLAELIHELSRRPGLFVRVNCAADENLLVTDLFGNDQWQQAGAIEKAVNGTVLLDNVDALPPALQQRLVSVLEENTVVRIGAAERRPVDVGEHHPRALGREGLGGLRADASRGPGDQDDLAVQAGTGPG